MDAKTLRMFAGTALGALALMCRAPVVHAQSVPPPAALSADSLALNQALARLGKNPRDVDALIEAGYAALALGDVDAAVGFFARADQILPNSPRVRAGLAGALVHNGNPFDAIPLFAEAEAAGGMDPKLYGERGLAYDLVGDNATAQKYYRMALAKGANDEATRRLALSLAISGNRSGMESTLAPLLQAGDKAALRIRAFGLAILNQPDAAVDIAYQSMPKDLAAGIAPYLRYMPRLTRAQKAAAANFGTFPRAADIGRDDPRVARFAPPEPFATADTALIPKGEPLGGKGDGKAKGKPTKGALAVSTPKVTPSPSGNAKGKDTKTALASTAPPRIAPPELNPRRDESSTPASLDAAAGLPAAKPPAVASASSKPPLGPAVPPPVGLRPPAGVGTGTPPLPAASPASPPVTSSGFDLATVSKTPGVPASPPPPSASPPPASSAPPIAPTPASPPRSASFAAAFGDLGAPQIDAAPSSGAVDVRKLAAAKPAAAAKSAATSKPLHPSRVWVQVGTGRDKPSMAFTWRALVKDEPEMFRGKLASITNWGKTNRLLAGPFDTEASANAFVTRLRKAKLDGFVWTSPAGQVVDPLSVK